MSAQALKKSSQEICEKEPRRLQLMFSNFLNNQYSSIKTKFENVFVRVPPQKINYGKHTRFSSDIFCNPNCRKLCHIIQLLLKNL